VVPAWARLDMNTIIMGAVTVCWLNGMLMLSYGKATWHLGRLKRLFISATIMIAVGFAVWQLEEGTFLSAWPCPVPISLHTLWHVCAAYSLLAWTAFLKYHRGMFFGFRVELKGRWWCPYVTWSEPLDGSNNPMVRHSSSHKSARRAGRRNSYITEKAQRPSTASIQNIKMAWRGESFFRGQSTIPEPTTAKRRATSIVNSFLARRASGNAAPPTVRPASTGPAAAGTAPGRRLGGAPLGEGWRRRRLHPRLASPAAQRDGLGHLRRRGDADASRTHDLW